MLNRVLAVFAAATLSFAAHAAVTPAVEDLEYLTQKVPQAVTTGKKIEVLEFFWYRCPHCFKLEPALKTWIAKLPKDVQIKRVPAVFNDSWLPGAKIFYALQDVGAGRLHDEAFKAYHLDNIDLNNETVLMDWVAKKGVDRTKFEAAYKSFSTQSRATQGGALARVYDLKGVPSFVVDGRYVTSETMTGSEPRLFEVLDQLITKARKARPAGKSAHKK